MWGLFGMAWKIHCVFVWVFQMMYWHPVIYNWRFTTPAEEASQVSFIFYFSLVLTFFFFLHNTHLSDRNIDGNEKTVRVLVTRACLPSWKISVVSVLYFTRPWHVLICHWEIWQHPIQIIHFVLLELQAPYCFPLITFNSSWDVLEFIYTEDWPIVHMKYIADSDFWSEHPL